MNQFLRALPVACLFAVAGCEPSADGTARTDAAALPSTENSRDFGDYVVHFNAISTDQLTPEIARRYDIVRSRNRAMLNVSIIKKEAGTPGRPVSGSVFATAVNLTGQQKDLSVREIREEEAVYFIGEVAIANAETLVFTIDVTPINEPSRFSVRYMKQFFVD
ncbi:MAG TPA: DUF4426 domain-containing protein [Gammaproteobacteria bacterium]|jgi:hypothetical protein